MQYSILAQAPAGGTEGMIYQVVMWVGIFAVFYFFMIRPQQKKQKEIRKFQNALKEGDKIITNGGIYGTVRRVDLAANTVEVEIARGTVITVDKNYVFADASAQAQK